MDESIEIRKAKAKARAEVAKSADDAKLEKEQFCLATAVDAKWLAGPLIFDRVHIPECESEDD